MGRAVASVVACSREWHALLQNHGARRTDDRAHLERRFLTRWALGRMGRARAREVRRHCLVSHVVHARCEAGGAAGDAVARAGRRSRYDVGERQDLSATHRARARLARTHLPAGTLHAGENTIAVAALDTYATGGMLGTAGQRKLTLADGTVDSAQRRMEISDRAGRHGRSRLARRGSPQAA